MMNWLMMKAMAVSAAGKLLAVETSILPDDFDIDKILKLILNILVYGLGAAAVLGVIIAGIQYMTARDDVAQVAKAKKRLIEIVIGLVAWALMFTVLNWLIPGGLTIS
jgi:type IV secretory pathway VirB2 component (pilin)